jgi:epoxyqueuosine reductase
MIAGRLVNRVGMVVGQPRVISRLAWLPSLPSYFRRDYAAHRGEWSAPRSRIPDALKTVPGIWRDREAEDETFERDPLYDFLGGNPWAMQFMTPHMWRAMVPAAPRLERARRMTVEVSSQSRSRNPGSGPPPAADPSAITAAVKAKAAEVGLSALGIAPYDQRYEYMEYKAEQVGDRVIVCVLEQNYAATQTIPSARAEQAALGGYAEAMQLATLVGRELLDRGFRVVVHEPERHHLVIHYAVEAGLGQLGLNGQLLTPAAGSRCRLITINTNAPLVFDHPVDYGIHAICDACKACIRRCPVNAIPGKREWYRGVLKSKLDTKRCLPIVAQADGCSICMKVCPIQKYGLTPVIDEFERSGKILDRGTDELEGYDWPLDGKHYSPGAHPEIPLEIREPPGMVLEMNPKP